jgi:hypothetical protein
MIIPAECRQSRSLLRCAVIRISRITGLLSVMLLLPALSACSQPEDRTDVNGFIYFHRVELTDPPIGWRASFFYANDAGLIQVGREIGDQLAYAEWTSPKIWKKLAAEVPFNVLSDPLVPQPRPVRATTGNGAGAIMLWVSAPGARTGGWMGNVKQAEGAILQFHKMLSDLLEVPAHAKQRGADADVHGFIRCSWLDARTTREFEKADLFVALPAEALAAELMEAIHQPFKIVPVRQDANPFVPWRSVVRWGRTAVETVVQERPVQIRSWARSESAIE